jgi:hypothetical protein
MSAGEAGAYPSEAPFRCSTLGSLLALPTNIRLGWKGLPGTNALAYYKNSGCTAVKSFITLTQGLKILPDTHSNIIRKFVKYVRKKSYNIGPSLVVIRNLTG